MLVLLQWHCLELQNVLACLSTPSAPNYLSNTLGRKMLASHTPARMGLEPTGQAQFNLYKAFLQYTL